ncbi:MAG: hypothetical protein ACE5IZ_04770 [Dehalococcoidia bacterium]
MAKGLAFAVLGLVTALALAACGGGGASVAPSPTAEPEPTPTPTPSPPSTPTVTASPTPEPTPTPQPALLHFQGQTFAFDYPQDWHIWTRSYQNGQETVVLANIPPATDGRGGLPTGAIKVDMASGQRILTGNGPPEDAQLLSFPPSNVKFFLSQGGEVPWVVQGTFRAQGRYYIVSVLMETDEPQIEDVRPILSSWRPLAP